MLRNDAAIARLGVRMCRIGRLNREDGQPLTMVDFMPYAIERAVESDDEPTVEETVKGFMSVLGAKKNG